MKLFQLFFLITALLALALAGSVEKKSFIVMFPEGTPNSIIEDAKKAIVDAGGLITHTFALFRGFAAEAPLAALETVRTLSTNYQPIIEEDQPVSINAA
ncbi:hypothetical protein VTN49DRAFT_7984 [Thermomyces lanuginosus]|uniref:uncharacterized protein n=1 Tax=Thermomyces lanuginosus TaxID=5541 RepID=UPI003743B70D